MFLAQAFLAQRFEQTFRCHVRFALGQLFGFGKFLVKNFFLRAGGKIGAGGHRNGAGKHRCETGYDNDNVALYGALNSRQQTDRADQTVLNTEDELTNPRAALDDLSFLLNDFKRHGKLRVRNAKINNPTASCGISIRPQRIFPNFSPPNVFIGGPIRNSPGFLPKDGSVQSHVADPLKACGNDDSGLPIK